MTSINMSQKRWRIFVHAIATLFLTLGMPMSMSHADVIKVPIGQQGKQTDTQKPRLGMSMEMVEQQFGKPVTHSPARGKPPIIRWEYNEFVVYFEGSHVIHSVLKHRRKDTD